MPADRGSNTATTLAYGASASEREKSLDLTVTQIERRFVPGRDGTGEALLQFCIERRIVGLPDERTQRECRQIHLPLAER